MKHFVYIIYSEKFDKYYKGYSTDPFSRLKIHNEGFSRYTKQFRPWKLVFIQSFDNKSDALKREISLKKYSHLQIKYLINSSLNELE